MYWMLHPLSVFLFLAVGGQPEPIRLGQPVTAVEAPIIQRPSIAFSPDGKKLAWVFHQPEKAANDGGGLMIHLWDVEKRYVLMEMKAANDFTWACSPLRFTPNGRMIALGCAQLTTEHEQLAKPGTLVRTSVRLWLVASGKELPFAPREEAVAKEVWQALAVVPTGKAIIGMRNKDGRVWTVPDGKVERRIKFEPKASEMVLSADGKLAAGIVRDNAIAVWTTDDGKEMLQLPDAGHALGISVDGKRLATANDSKVCLWDLESSKLLWDVPVKLTIDERKGPRFDFSPNGQRLAWNDNGKITVIDAANGKETTTFTSPPGPIAFSPDGRRLAVACPDGTALVWEVK